MTPLWEATRDLHHACEVHPVGAAMASGTPPMLWYAQWVRALLQIHRVVDRDLPPIVRRSSRLLDDLICTKELLEPIDAAEAYAVSLKTPQQLAGAAYVLTGAHLMGGEVMRRRLEGYPTRHLEWDDRKAALAELNKLRQRTDIVSESRDCFKALLAVMEEIQHG